MSYGEEDYTSKPNTASVAQSVAVTGITGLGTGVATALAINTGSAGSHVTNGGALGTPSSGTLTNCSGLPNTGIAAASGAGCIVQVLQGQLTTVTTVANSSYADISGLSQAITPQASTSKILVRAVISFDMANNNDVAMFQLVRGSTAIGIGTSAGSRTQASGAHYENIVAQGADINTIVLEWLDSPNTTSSTTYKVQALTAGGSTITINSTATDTDSAGFPRTVSTITVMEVK